VYTTTTEGRPYSYPEPDARSIFADILDHLAEVLRVRGTLTTSGLDLREVAEQGDDLLAALEDRIGNTPADSLTLAVGLAGMVLPARHAWQQLVEVERARMT
jgi:hypothetical protein